MIRGIGRTACIPRRPINGLRKHIKIEDPRFLYWADQLGLLIWADAPSPVTFNDTANRRLVDDLRRMIERDYNHPSIIVWGPYNESWGLEFRSNRAIQEYLAGVVEQVRAWDPSRLVVDNSGWRHVVTDIADTHKYTGDPSEWRGFLSLLTSDPMAIQVLGHPFYALGRYHYDGEPIMVSEYGGGWRDDRSWDFRWQTNELRRHPGIVGYTYTELYDIEHEYAGFALYDRTPKDFGYDPAMINSPDFVVLDYREDAHLQPGSALSVGVSVSAYGLPALEHGTISWRLQTTAAEPFVLASGDQTLDLTPFTVTEAQPIALTVPDYTGAAQLWAELTDEQGNVRARNYLDFEIVGPALAAYQARSEDGSIQHLYRLDLDDNEGEFSPLGPLRVAAIRGTGERPILFGRNTGYMLLSATLPESNGAWQSVRFETEIASNPFMQITTMALVGQGYATDVVVSINDVPIGNWHVPDRPVNALGAMTRLNGLGVGEHGYWMQVEVTDPAVLAQIEAAAREQGQVTVQLAVPVDAENTGGITLFGERAGQYGSAPLLTIQTSTSEG